MDSYIVHGSTAIPRGGLLVIENGKGVAVEVWDGELWITQAHDRRDHFVRSGDSFRIEREGQVVVSALSPGRITLTAPVPAYYARRVVLIHAGAPRVLYERSRERAGWLAGIGYRLARLWTNSYASYFNATAAAL
jgi:hypothetical protein